MLFLYSSGSLERVPEITELLCIIGAFFPNESVAKFLVKLVVWNLEGLGTVADDSKHESVINDEILPVLSNFFSHVFRENGNLF